MLDITTKLDGCKITQELADRQSKIMHRLIIDTSDRLIHRKLIELGWTPPGMTVGTYDGFDCRVCPDLPDDHAVITVGRTMAAKLMNLTTKEDQRA